MLFFMLYYYNGMIVPGRMTEARKGDAMDISNSQSTAAEVQRQPILRVVRIICWIVLFSCSLSLPVMTFYINRTGTEAAAPYESTVLLAISLGVLALCTAFVLILCRKPIFLTCTIACFFLLFLFGAWMCVLFASLLCAAIAGAALLADAKGASYLPFAIAVPAAYLAAFALTRDPLLSLNALLPAIVALAFGICFKKKYSIIISVGTATGALAIAFILFFAIDMAAAGIPLNMQGINDTVKAYHAALSSVFGEAMMLMTETEEMAAQVSQMLGGEITPEKITEFSDSIATAILGLLPGITIMALWIFSFVAHRGFTAILIGKQPREVCPAHMSAYSPSVPSAILLLLCYAVMMIAAMFPKGETVLFVALNLLLILMPMITVHGILGIIGNIKQARVKWPLILTYALAIMFLGIAVIPMVAFFGAFGIILAAIARALERKLNSSQGGPMT